MPMNSVLFKSLADTVLTIGMFTLVPRLFYHGKSLRGFLDSVGVYLPRGAMSKSTYAILVGVAVLAFGITSTLVLSGLSDRAASDSAQSFSDMEFVIYLLFFGLRTGVGEEIFFRGFLAKRLISRFGYSRGNLMQSLLFGLPHYLNSGNTLDRLFRVVTASLLGYTFGYVMDRKCQGSIVPAMVAHCLYNITASTLLSMIYYYVLT